jgi:anoctamin-10/anoctamin-7
MAPTMSPTTGSGLAPPFGNWWISMVVLIGVVGMMYLGIKKVLKQAEEKRKRIQKNLKLLRKRVIAADEFYKAHLYSWDWVMVFKVAEADEKPTNYQKKHNVKTVVSRLCEAGLQTSMFYSVQQDEVYCKIRAHPDRLKTEADRINHPMPLDENFLKQICDDGRKETKGWGPIKYTCFANELTPFKGHYSVYDRERDAVDDIPFKKYDSATFRGVDRIKLISSIIEAPSSERGCGLKIKDLVVKKACLAVFPLHDYLGLTMLQHKWLRLFTPPHRQPEDEIKDYFGEKIGLYFVWLGHYTKWLISASFVGFIIWMAISADGDDPDSPSIPYFTVFMAIWATLYLESWKRTEKQTACRWGMVDFEQEQQPRPEFDAISFWRESPVTGQQEKYFPDELRYPVLVYSTAISSTFIITVASAIVAIYIFKAFLSDPAPYGKVYFGSGNPDDDSSFALGSIIGSSMNAIQIMVMNVIYEKVAEKLTDKENHRTETEYEDALISKTFSFQFVNSFMALIYLAFIKQPLAIHGIAGETRCFPNCFAELNTSLGIILIANIVAGNLGEILPPIINARLKARAESKGAVLESANVKLTDVEKQFIAEEYDVLMGTFKDYGEMVIQFGYCTLFVAAFPLAPLIAFVNNWIELRIDGWKLCEIHRRPYAVGAEDIGTWFFFLDIMSTLAVVSNMALFVFTGTQLKWTATEKVVFFSVMEHVLLCLKFLIAVIIPDVPGDVEEHMAREEFIISKVVHNIADDEEDQEYESNEMIDLSVKLTDLVPALDKDAAKAAMV